MMHHSNTIYIDKTCTFHSNICSTSQFMITDFPIHFHTVHVNTYVYRYI